MSLRALTWALSGRNPARSPQEVMVLVALGEHADEDGRGAYPTLDAIAARARMARAEVWQTLCDLEDAGVISRAVDQELAVQAMVGRCEGPGACVHVPVVWDLAIDPTRMLGRAG